MKTDKKIHFAFEDFSGVTGDVFFDNIRLEALVESSGNLLKGSSGNDKLSGSNKNEIIEGGGGSDTLDVWEEMMKLMAVRVMIKSTVVLAKTY